jgi:hypothetical protein
LKHRAQAQGLNKHYANRSSYVISLFEIFPGRDFIAHILLRLVLHRICSRCTSLGGILQFLCGLDQDDP